MAQVSPVQCVSTMSKRVENWEENMNPQLGSNYAIEEATEHREILQCKTYTMTTGTDESASHPGSPTEPHNCRTSTLVITAYEGQDHQRPLPSIQQPAPPGQVFNPSISDQPSCIASGEGGASLPLPSPMSEEASVPPPPYGSTEVVTQMNTCCKQNKSPVSATIHCNEGDIHMQLENQDLWLKFHSVDTEMIITKSGRRMFPGLSVSVWGLESDVKYTVQCEMVPTSNNRFKYINSKWTTVGKAEVHDSETLTFQHQDSPASGKQWMRDRISFKKIKLTNDKNSKKGYVVLNSMHRYQPRIYVFKHLSRKEMEKVYSVDFPQTQFVAVTAYQNDLVTQLKIDNNPFAKAFRESSEDMPYGYATNGVMMTNPWGGHLGSPAEYTPLSPISPLPQFGMAFGPWDSNNRSPISPSSTNTKKERSIAPWQLMPLESPLSATGSHSPFVFPHMSAAANCEDMRNTVQGHWVTGSPSLPALTSLPVNSCATLPGGRVHQSHLQISVNTSPSVHPMQQTTPQMN